MRFLAAVPSVVYGLIGILVLAPWINDHLVSESFKQAVKPIVVRSAAAGCCRPR